LNGAGPVEHVTDNRFVPESDWVQPAGAVEVIVKVTAPANPLAGTTAIWDVPAVFAVVVIEDGVAVREKSCMVTGTSTNAEVDPLVPVTLTVKVPPEEQVTERVAVCAGGRTTLPSDGTVQDPGTPVVVRMTVPENVPVGVTVITEVPAVPATVVIEVGLALRVNPATALTVTETPTVRVMEPLTPCTVTVKVGVWAEQVTESKPVALTVAVQPAGCVEVTENVTAPANPLIALTVTCDVPAVLAVVVIAGAERVKS
jgi:hypothetical protein